MTSYYWHKETKEPHKAVFDVANAIERDQAWRAAGNRNVATVYRDRAVSGFSPGSWRFSSTNLSDMRTAMASSVLGRPLTFNLVRSAIDTLTSQRCLGRPMPKVLTSCAEEDVQQQARALERYIWGVLVANKAHMLAAQAFARDPALYGDGYIYGRVEDRRIVLEVLHTDTVFVDDNAALNGDARSLFRRDWTDREALLALFGDDEDKRKVIDAATSDEQGSDQLGRDLVRFVDAWHLPRGGESGRHLIALENGILFDEPWDSPRFPIAHVAFKPDLRGWHGTGAADELLAIQLELNESVAKVSGNMSHLANPYVAAPRSANIQEEHWTEALPYRFLPYDGPVAPQIVCPPAVNEQVFQYIELLWRRGFECLGLSQLSATAQKPAGMYSGIAMTSYLDVENTRFAAPQQRYEQGFVDLAWLIYDLGKMHGNLRGVVSPDEKGAKIEFVDWTKLDLDEEQIAIQISPASALPKSFSGRLQKVVELAQAGVMDKRWLASLLDDPDLDKFSRLENAPLEDLIATAEHMLSTDDYIEPGDYQDCALGIRVMQRYWSLAKMGQRPQEKIGLLEMWMRDAAAKLQAGKGQPPDIMASAPPPQARTAMAMPSMPGPGGAAAPANMLPPGPGA